MGEIASPSQLRMYFLRWALVTVPLILLLGVASGQLSGSGYGNPWFDALIKPDLMPPGWVFGVVWPILYILMGFSLALVLSARGAAGRGLAIGLFVVQFVLNLAWSPVYFGAHDMVLALGLIAAMFVTTLVTILLFRRIRPLAALLLLPYLGWLLFAGLLNYQTIQLNPDAGGLAPEAGAAQIGF